MTAANSLSETFIYNLNDVFDYRIDYDSMDIWQALNHNDLGILWITGINDSVRLFQIKSIFKSYIKLQLSNNKIPVYDGSKYKQKDMQDIIVSISKKSGQQTALITRVMNQFYWYIKQGVIKYSDILNPRDAVINYGNRYHPSQPLRKITETAGNILTTSKDLLDNAVKGVGGLAAILQFLPYILVGGFIIGGGIYLYRIMPKKPQTGGTV